MFLSHYHISKAIFGTFPIVVMESVEQDCIKMSQLYLCYNFLLRQV